DVKGILMSHLTWRRYAIDDHTLERVAAVESILGETEAAAERERRMPADAVAAIQDSGLWQIASPRAVGGDEVSPLVEYEVYEAVSRISTTGAWNVYIGSFNTSLIAAYVDDNAIDAMYRGGASPVVAGQFPPVGRAERVDGGLCVSGHYSW